MRRRFANISSRRWMRTLKWRKEKTRRQREQSPHRCPTSYVAVSYFAFTCHSFITKKRNLYERPTTKGKLVDKHHQKTQLSQKASFEKGPFCAFCDVLPIVKKRHNTKSWAILSLQKRCFLFWFTPLFWSCSHLWLFFSFRYRKNKLSRKKRSKVVATFE